MKTRLGLCIIAVCLHSAVSMQAASPDPAASAAANAAATRSATAPKTATGAPKTAVVVPKTTAMVPKTVSMNNCHAFTATTLHMECMKCMDANGNVGVKELTDELGQMHVPQVKNFNPEINPTHGTYVVVIASDHSAVFQNGEWVDKLQGQPVKRHKTLEDILDEVPVGRKDLPDSSPIKRPYQGKPYKVYQLSQ